MVQLLSVMEIASIAERMVKTMRLIDADALEFEPDENYIANGVLIWGGRSGGKTMTTVLFALKEMIKNAPTVDAVEVVRCKDCKHAFPDGFGWYQCACRAMWNKGEYFCSYGERKDNDI
jgi:hypothetical protein